MDIINEGSSFQLDVQFLDSDGVAQTPSSASYSVHDLNSGTELIATTMIAPASSVELMIPPAASRVVRTSVLKEEHVVTIIANYGPTEAVTEEFHFLVRNLKFITL